MARSQRTKITLRDLGEPKNIVTMPVDVKEYALGRLIGIAKGFIARTNPKDGTAMEGLSGEFRSVPSENEIAKGREELESGVLFIPDAFHTMIAAALRAAQKDDPMAEIRFAFDVKAIRANNPQGYSWDFKPLIERPEGANRLDELTKQLAVLPKPDAPKQVAATGKK